MNIKVLQSEDAAAITSLELVALGQTETTEVEKQFISWQAKWRPEALEHYLGLGWSFGVWEGEEGHSPLLAYFLGQPILFWEGHAQTLWIEHVSAREQRLADEILDVAFRVAREKHFQKLILSPSVNLNSSQLAWVNKCGKLLVQDISTSKILS